MVPNQFVDSGACGTSFVFYLSRRLTDPIDHFDGFPEERNLGKKQKEIPAGNGIHPQNLTAAVR
jgi:hypothetical protein